MLWLLGSNASLDRYMASLARLGIVGIDGRPVRFRYPRAGLVAVPVVGTSKGLRCVRGAARLADYPWPTAVTSLVDIPKPISFRAHDVRTGTVDGARADFQQMVVQLVGARYRGARSIKPNPGDWGIDCFTGQLDGVIVVWQAKYFPDGVTKSHQQEIRDSFSAAVTAAQREGFAIQRWILCVPSSMDAPTAKWWDGWRKRQERETGIKIELWDESLLVRFLISPDARHVRAEYYGASSPARRRPLSRLPGDVDYDGALFVRQLSEAGHVEFQSAKEQFFNAEILSREVRDKGIPEECDALDEADIAVNAVWESEFNRSCVTNSGRDLPELHQTVMGHISDSADRLSGHLPLHPVQAMGIMHQVVDLGRAGWVRDFRTVALRHQSDGGAAPAAATSPAGAGTEGSS